MATIHPVARAFVDAGHALYFVGGVVRDLSLVSSDVTDLDLTTDAPPEVIRTLIAPMADELWTQGERFGTIGARVGPWAIEITTHRGEVYSSESRKPEVVFGTDLQTDLSRRDFTINAMAFDALTGRLHDPFGGAADLRNRVLRTPLDPGVSFTDDPLRMMRAARFIPRFELVAGDEIVAAVEQFRDRLEIVSRERIHDELERLLALETPSSGLLFLASTGLLDRFAELNAPAVDVAATVAGASSPLARRAVLAGSTVDPGEWLRGLRYSTADRHATLNVVEGVATIRTAEPSPALMRRLVASVGRSSAADVFDAAAVQELDVAPWVRQLADLEATEDLDTLTSPLSGGQIMSELGLDPGPSVGDYTRRLRDVRLDEGPLTVEQALALLRQWHGDEGA